MTIPMYHPDGAIGACATVGRMSLVRVGQRGGGAVCQACGEVWVEPAYAPCQVLVGELAG